MRVLICGISGQDGAYLARFLLQQGYEIWGTSRDAQMASFINLERLKIKSSVTFRSMAPNDFRSVFTVLNDCKPNEIYFLAGQSSVGLSFEQPAETLESVCIGALNIMEAMRLLGLPIRLYHASSSECFGEMYEQPADESTPFAPRSPYAVAKASAHWLVANYREAYGLYACNGILFNHESPLRPMRYVTRKIVAAACQIARGKAVRLELGRIDIVRDWGWAPEYVEAMWRMLQREKPCDYVIATGESNSLQSFVEAVFGEVGLDWREHVDIVSSLCRPTDLTYSRGNPERALRELSWHPKLRMRAVVKEMVRAELEQIDAES